MATNSNNINGSGLNNCTPTQDHLFRPITQTVDLFNQPTNNHLFQSYQLPNDTTNLTPINQNYDEHLTNVNIGSISKSSTQTTHGIEISSSFVPQITSSNEEPQFYQMSTPTLNESLATHNTTVVTRPTNSQQLMVHYSNPMQMNQNQPIESYQVASSQSKLVVLINVFRQNKFVKDCFRILFQFKISKLI